MSYYIFDIDGTLADCQHRLHFITGKTRDYRAFFAACDKDTLIIPVAQLVEDLLAWSDIVYVSGRSDECEEKTKNWLMFNNLWDFPATELYMREEGDHREDHIVKSELYDKILEVRHVPPVMVFDDRKQVVDMWRSRGLVCCQVAEGNF